MSEIGRLTGIPIVEDVNVPPRTAYLMRQDGRQVLLRRPSAPRWWRHPRRWLQQARTDRWHRRERRRRAEMVEWLALYRPDLRFVGWGRTGGALVAPRRPERLVVVSHRDLDTDRFRLRAEMRAGLSVARVDALKIVGLS